MLRWNRQLRRSTRDKMRKRAPEDNTHSSHFYTVHMSTCKTSSLRQRYTEGLSNVPSTKTEPFMDDEYSIIRVGFCSSTACPLYPSIHPVLVGASQTRPTDAESRVSCAVQRRLLLLSTWPSSIRRSVQGIGPEALRPPSLGQMLTISYIRSPTATYTASSIYNMRTRPHNWQLPPRTQGTSWTPISLAECCTRAH